MQTELITVRQSRSVVGRFNVYIEKGKNRHRLTADLSELEAIAIARAKAHLLHVEVKLFTLHPDLETIIIDRQALV